MINLVSQVPNLIQLSSSCITFKLDNWYFVTTVLDEIHKLCLIQIIFDCKAFFCCIFSHHSTVG